MLKNLKRLENLLLLKDDDTEEIIYEAADITYHVLVEFCSKILVLIELSKN